MRIGFLGPAGSGKTTLVKRIGKDYSLHVVAEGVRELCEQQKMDLANARAVDHIKFQWAVSNKRNSQIAVSPNFFVSDRTPLDNLLYMLQYFPDGVPAFEMLRYRAAMLNDLSMYDVIFVVPPFTHTPEADGFRHVNPGHNAMWWLAARELVREAHLLADYPRFHTLKTSGLEDRIREIQDALLIDFSIDTPF